MPETYSPVSVALLYASTGGDGQLRDALTEYGAAIVYEALSAEIDRDKLEGSGARVVVVNLGKDSDDYIDQVYDVLETGEYEVVFNDAEVSRQLSGWDQARWARNLAAKITNQPDVAEPPRPENAKAIPQATSVVSDPAQQARKPVPPATVIEPVTEPPGLEDESEDEADWRRVALALSEEAPIAVPPPETEPPFVAPDASATSKADDPDTLDLADLGAFALVDDGDSTTQDPFNSTDDSELLPPSAASDRAGSQRAQGGPSPRTQPGSVAAAPNAAASKSSFDLPADFDLTLDAVDKVEKTTGDKKTAANLLTDDEEQAIGRRADVHNLKSLFSPEWDLEPMNAGSPGDTTAVGQSGAADFGIDKISPTEYMDSPELRSAAAAIPVSSENSRLELMPMAEAIRPTVSEDNVESLPGAGSSMASSAPIDRVCVLGASIGGPEAVRDFLALIPDGFPVLFVLVQHMGQEFLELMSAQLRRSITLTVREPTHGERVANGDVLIVPPTHRLKVDREGVITFEKLWEEPANSPSIDQVLHDIADVFGENVVAIIFSGMANDALDGGRYLKSVGGKIWTQDPKTCVVSTMVEGVQKAGLSEFAGSPAQLAQHLIAEYA